MIKLVIGEGLREKDTKVGRLTIIAKGKNTEKMSLQQSGGRAAIQTPVSAWVAS